jgi:hypothetical protein
MSNINTIVGYHTMKKRTGLPNCPAANSQHMRYGRPLSSGGGC